MDRLDAVHAFVVTVEAGGLSAAARKLGRSAAAVTRTVAALEQRLGVALLRRTTRGVRLTEAGERYLAACRRVLADVAEAEQLAAGARSAVRGALTVTAPSAFGALHVRPILDQYLAAHPEVTASLLLLDRVVNLVDEGIDVGVRIAILPDSSLRSIKVGEVRRVLCASPDYCARRGRPKAPRDLAAHTCISSSGTTPTDTWTFASGRSGRAQHVKVRPALTVNSALAAIASAVDGHGVTRVLSYQVAGELAAGRLVRLLPEHEPAPLPVHVVHPPASAATARVRAFIDLAVPRLRAVLARSPAGRSEQG
jgi:DNA-binding transcriptional LysR family regulator